MSTLEVKSRGYHHGDLRGALVAAGLAILEEGGDPSALSLREAARRAGVSAMAPYRHFADKDALLAAVAEIGFRQLATALGEADRHENATEALIGQGVAYVAFASTNPALFRLMFGRSSGCAEKRPTAASESAFAVMANRVAALVGAEQAQDRALHCWATAHGIAALSLDGQFEHLGIAPPDLAERVLRLSAVPLSA